MQQPPVVKDNPYLQLLHWTFRPLSYLDNCARRYGDCFYLRLAGVEEQPLFISHPEAVAELFSPANSQLLDAGVTQFILQNVLGQYSTMLLDGEEHRRHRRLVMPPFHGGRMRTYGDIICQVTKQQTQSWVPGKQIRMVDTLSEITIQVILKAVFGIQGTQGDQVLIQRIRKFLDLFSVPIMYVVAFLPFLQKNWGSWSPAGQYLKQMDELHNLLLTEIRDRRTHLDPNAIDVLSMLLMARDEDGEAMTDQELLDEMLTLLFAGHDSSAVVFSWVFYWILSHPEVKDRLLAEIDSLGDDPDPTAISKLPYLDAVCSESMRLRAAVPSGTARLTKGPITLQGYELPKRSVIVPALHLTHHRADIYPDPYRFNPDRFLERRYSSSEFYPYGGGTRLCVGAAFASYEMRLIVATILRRYELELKEPRIPTAMRRGMNIAPKGGVRVVMKGVRGPGSTPASEDRGLGKINSLTGLSA